MQSCLTNKPRMGLARPQITLSARSSAFTASPVFTAPRICYANARATVAVEVDAKLKTKKAAAKRFRVTGSGKLMARHAGKQHLNEKMSRSSLKRLTKDFTVSEAKVKNIVSCLPNHKIGSK